MKTIVEETYDILMESLKIQAQQYKLIVDVEGLTHEQRKEFDTEIKQMYQLLAEMTATSTVYTFAEIQALKIQYEAKIQELQNTLDNIDVTTVKGDTGANGIDGTNGLDGQDGDDGLSAYEIALNNGFVGSESLWLESLKGQNGIDGTNGADGQDGTNGLDGLDGLDGQDGTNGADGQDGQNGLSAYEIALNSGFVGSQSEWLESLKGAAGQNLIFEDLTQEQKQELINLIPVPIVDLTEILNRLEALENQSNVTPPDVFAAPDVNFSLANLYADDEGLAHFEITSLNKINTNLTSRIMKTNIPDSVSIDSSLEFTFYYSDNLEPQSYPDYYKAYYLNGTSLLEYCDQNWSFSPFNNGVDDLNEYTYAMPFAHNGFIYILELASPQIVSLNKKYCEWKIYFSKSKPLSIDENFIPEYTVHSIEPFITETGSFDFGAFMQSGI